MKWSIRLFGVFVLYIVAIVQSFAGSALQAILQLFFSDLKIPHATTWVNLYICGYLLSGVFGGVFADRVGKSGNFWVGMVGSFMWAAGAAVFALPINGPPLDDTTILIGLILTAVGYGIVNPTQVVFCGSQYDTISEAESEATVIAYLYLSYNIGNLGGESAGPALRQTLGPKTALIAIFIAAAAGAVIYLLGSPLYRNAIVRRRNAPVVDPQQQALLAEESASESINLASSSANTTATVSVPISWMQALCIVVPLIPFYAILYQQNTTMVTQGALLDRHFFGTKVMIPADLMSSLEDWMLLFVIPFLDYIVYPKIAFLKNGSNDDCSASLSGSRHLIARMILGLFASCLAMICCAVLSSVSQPHVTSILYQTIALFCLSCSEALVAISGLQLIVSETRRRRADSAAMATALWLALGSLGAAAGAGVAQLPLNAFQAFVLWSVVGFLGTLSLFVAHRKSFQPMADEQ